MKLARDDMRERKNRSSVGENNSIRVTHVCMMIDQYFWLSGRPWTFFLIILFIWISIGHITYYKFIE